MFFRRAGILRLFLVQSSRILRSICLFDLPHLHKIHCSFFISLMQSMIIMNDATVEMNSAVPNSVNGKKNIVACSSSLCICVYCADCSAAFADLCLCCVRDVCASAEYAF